MSSATSRSRSGACRPHSLLFLGTSVLVAGLFLVGFTALGTWQLHRRVWKLDLIARVEQRVHAPPVSAPTQDRWTSVSAATDEYRHVFSRGAFLNSKETLVYASTQLGQGFWVITPFQREDGTIVLINRGFVPSELRDGAAASAPGGSTTVTGLLRITEPRGAFLRQNDPPANRWFSRDVQAIGAARGLTRVAPYFIDAERSPDTGTAKGAPVAGLTVIAFHNSHLVYALTWYTLALMVAVAAGLGARDELRARSWRALPGPI